MQSINYLTANNLPSGMPLACSEEQLVRMLKNRDEKGFVHLYTTYSDALLSVIMKIVPDKNLAADILHDLFTKLYNNIDNYDPTKKNLHGWMLTIARNLAIDVTLSKGYRNNLQVNDDIMPLHDSMKLCTEQSTDHIGVLKLLQALKPKYRDVIELNYLHGYSKFEISEMLGIPLGTVKTRIGAGLIKLRAIA